MEPLDMEPLNIEKAPVCPLGPSLGTLVPGPAYVPARWPRLGVLLVGPAYVRKYWAEMQELKELTHNQEASKTERIEPAIVLCWIQLPSQC